MYIYMRGNSIYNWLITSYNPLSNLDADPEDSTLTFLRVGLERVLLSQMMTLMKIFPARFRTPGKHRWLVSPYPKWSRTPPCFRLIFSFSVARLCSFVRSMPNSEFWYKLPKTPPVWWWNHVKSLCLFGGWILICPAAPFLVLKFLCLAFNSQHVPQNRRGTRRSANHGEDGPGPHLPDAALGYCGWTSHPAVDI